MASIVLPEGIQILRGVEANRASIIPDVGEPVWATDTKQMYMGDGATPGGVPAFSIADGSVTRPMLGGGIIDGSKITDGAVTTAKIDQASFDAMFLRQDGSNALKGHLLPDGDGTRALGGSGNHLSNVHTNAVTSGATITLNSVNGVLVGGLTTEPHKALRANITANNNYETFVTHEDDIPNKKYVDDLVTGSAVDSLYSANGVLTETRLVNLGAQRLAFYSVNGSKLEMTGSAKVEAWVSDGTDGSGFSAQHSQVTMGYGALGALAPDRFQADGSGLGLVFDADSVLKVQGVSGSAGQVLTSNGGSVPPSWADAAGANTISLSSLAPAQNLKVLRGSTTDVVATWDAVVLTNATGEQYVVPAGGSNTAGAANQTAFAALPNNSWFDVYVSAGTGSPNGFLFVVAHGAAPTSGAYGTGLIGTYFKDAAGQIGRLLQLGNEIYGDFGNVLNTTAATTGDTALDLSGAVPPNASMWRYLYEVNRTGAGTTFSFTIKPIDGVPAGQVNVIQSAPSAATQRDVRAEWVPLAEAQRVYYTRGSGAWTLTLGSVGYAL